MASHPKRPRDISQLAKRIVDLATESAVDPSLSKKAIGGKAGGLKGGSVRAERLTPAQRADIARLAAEARWKNRDR